MKTSLEVRREVGLQMKGVKLTANNKIIIIDIPLPARQTIIRRPGEMITLVEMDDETSHTLMGHMGTRGEEYNIIIDSFSGGQLEKVPGYESLCLFCNFEMFIVEMEYNRAATVFMGYGSELLCSDRMFGNVVLLAQDCEGMLMGLTDEQVQVLCEILISDCPFLEVEYEERL